MWIDVRTAPDIEKTCSEVSAGEMTTPVADAAISRENPTRLELRRGPTKAFSRRHDRCSLALRAVAKHRGAAKNQTSRTNQSMALGVGARRGCDVLCE